MKTKASTNLPTNFGEFLVNVYAAENGQEALAIISGTIKKNEKVAVRVHSSCLTGEVLGSLKCDCKSQLDYGLKYISENGGVVVYLPQEGRGIGLTNKIKAYSLQEQGYDTVDANRELGLADDARTYNDAVEILSELGINKVQLITNNPSKVSSLIDLGVDVCERIPLPLISNPHSVDYLETKRKRMGHLYHEIDETQHTKTSSITLSERPVVHLNFVLNGEGKIASESGKALPLSCQQDRQRVHELREVYSAVAVGARTWRMDQPQLTARKEFLGREPRRQPSRVIFAGNQKCTFTQGIRQTFVIGSKQKKSEAIHIRAEDHSLVKSLSSLYQHGVDSILVEGGLTLLRSFIRERAFDKLTIFVRASNKEKARSSIASALPEIAGLNIECESLGEGFLFSTGKFPFS